MYKSRLYTRVRTSRDKISSTWMDSSSWVLFPRPSQMAHVELEYSNFSPNASFLFRACDISERHFEGSAFVNDSHSPKPSPETTPIPTPKNHPPASGSLRILREMTEAMLRLMYVCIYMRLFTRRVYYRGIGYDKIRYLS